ncbi:prepilin-type N-terminal cleavage/methylation domain-containing protein [Mahella australiensis]|uniref:Prepilin-type N-terminal cleavage/methylation domain-containing protein n=1 Tax=Mahella australiensis (strain DSM 15567 / CIP 107919 / 50-1 BON) TaxID=697281 RepID=F3ZVH1_MAHA5|nr:prepilin-type N-terminal cleavage/methylation domain-containing protein [Mahella australiensis]AEE96333.1 hypothetical protein Mahau_1136 [Mahella australiensis 50-1 BON]
MNEYKGFTLLEIIVAMAILGVIVIPFSGIFVQSTKVQATAGDISRAGYVAQNVIEDIRAGLVVNTGQRDGYYVKVQIEDYVSDGNAVGDEDNVLKRVDVKAFESENADEPLAVRQTIVALPR